MPLARYEGVAQDDAGNIIAEPEIEVRLESTGALVQLYSDRDGLSAIGNPFTGEVDGTFGLHPAFGGAYRITATKGVLSRTKRYVAIGTFAEHDYVASPSAEELASTGDGSGSGDVPGASLIGVEDAGGHFGSGVDNVEEALQALGAEKLGLFELFQLTQWEEAEVGSGGTIILDVENGAFLNFSRTLAGNEMLLLPVDMPEGATIYFLVDPTMVSGAALSFETGYVGAGGLPDVTAEALLSITAGPAGTGQRFFVTVVGADWSGGT